MLSYHLVALEHMETISQQVDQTIDKQEQLELVVELLMDLNKEVLLMDKEHLDHHMELVEPLMVKELLMVHHREQEAEVEQELPAMARVHHILETTVQQEQLEQPEQQEHLQVLDILCPDQVLEAMEHQVPDIMEETKND